jgi:hypothetical protein
MPILLALPVYPMKEICDKLAKSKGRKTYSRQRAALLIKEHIPTAQKIGNRYFLTDNEINLLVSKVSEKTLKKGLTIDN